MKQKPKAKPQVSKGKNTKPKAGLSFSEKKRLKELQRTLAGNRCVKRARRINLHIGKNAAVFL